MDILTEYKAEAFLEKEGFPVAQRTLCTTEEQALKTAKKNDFHVVLKVASDELLHKSEHNAVRLNITQENFHQTYKELNTLKIKKQGIIVQNYIHGKYLLIGLKKDLVFGHVLAVGMGGIYTEVIKDVAFRVVPVEKKDIKEMLQELKSFKILSGFRGEKVNLTLIENILLKISSLAEKYPSIQELDINPLIVNEKEAKIVNARIVFN